ncbi:MAG: ArnT family glycosyltransferase [Nitrospinales bacterium]
MNKDSYRYAARGLAATLLAVFACLALTGLEEKSATFDEGNHLVRGLYPLAGKGYLLNREHPPLINLLQALPVHVTRRPEIPEATPAMYPFFFHSGRVLWEMDNDGKAMIRQARRVTVGLALVLGFLVYLWARELHGEAGGLTALGLFVFSPMMLAHGRLVTTDMGLALCLFAFFFALSGLVRRPAPWRLAVAGLCLGAALASKHMALLALPVALLVLVLAERKTVLAPALGRTPVAKSRLNAVWVWLALVAIAFVVLWGVYGFQVGRIDGNGIPAPAPDYFGGLRQGWQSLETGRVYYLNGVISDKGWLAYFPLAFAYKTPLPVLILLVTALLLHLRGKFRVGKMTNFIALALGGIVLAVVLKRVNLGLRYLLWAYPFLFLYLGGVARVPRWRLLLIPVLGWLVFATLSAHPDYLSYFNRAVPQQEKRLYLVDSNLDWGQALPALARFQRERNIKTVRLGYFGTADPKAYGVVAEPLPSFLRRQTPLAVDELKLEGVIAVSATLLQGLYNRPPDFYAPLRKIVPTAQLGGGSILVFDCRKQAGECGTLPNR